MDGFLYFKTFLGFLDAVIESYYFSCYSYDFSSLTFYGQILFICRGTGGQFPKNHLSCLPWLLTNKRFRINLDFFGAVATSNP